jgi:hypothetical protein
MEVANGELAAWKFLVFFQVVKIPTPISDHLRGNGRELGKQAAARLGRSE